MKCAIFDMDGTLVDSMPMWHTVADNYLLANGKTPEKNLWDNVKRLTETETAEYFIKNYALKKSVPEICEEIENIIFVEYSKNVRLKDGVLEYLTFLASKNIPLALATATDKKCALACLERLGIKDFFKTILTCLELNTSKSTPLIFFKCAEICGAAAEESFVFEDALHCIRTAKRAGFKTVAVYDSSDEEITEPPESDWERITKIADFHYKSFIEIFQSNDFGL